MQKAVRKKRVIVAQDKLSEELQQMFSEIYAKKEDIEEKIIRIDRPDGDFFCCVPLETDDTSYLVKIKVTIDKNPEEDIEKDDDYGDDGADAGDMAGADELADQEDDTDSDE